MTIRQMLFSDIGFAVDLSRAEGWLSAARREFEGFLAYDPLGCLVAETGGTPVGICVATCYGRSGFISEVIVERGARGRGIGRQLVEHAIRYLRARKTENIHLEVTPTAVKAYEKYGFHRLCRSLRFVGLVPGRVHQHVRPLRTTDLHRICEIDRASFGAGRRFFLERRALLHPEFCKVLESNGGVAGFIMAHRGFNSVAVGPWVVRPAVECPADLLEGLAVEVGAMPLTIPVLESNLEAVKTLRALGFSEYPNPPWRMVLGHARHFATSPHLYAMGSPTTG